MVIGLFAARDERTEQAARLWWGVWEGFLLHLLFFCVRLFSFGFSNRENLFAVVRLLSGGIIYGHKDQGFGCGFK